MRVLIRDFRSDERAVASTVGTIMALLVFLTFLSVIVNQYVPIWMKDSEASHMNLALGQFGGIKGDIDLQMLAAQGSADAGTFHIPVTTATAVNLGVDGVPIFSSPTPGTLQLSPDAGAFTGAFDYILQRVYRHAGQPRSLAQPHVRLWPRLVPLLQPNTRGHAQNRGPVHADPVLGDLRRKNRRRDDLHNQLDPEPDDGHLHRAPRGEQQSRRHGNELHPPPALPSPGRHRRRNAAGTVLRWTNHATKAKGDDAAGCGPTEGRMVGQSRIVPDRHPELGQGHDGGDGGLRNPRAVHVRAHPL